MTSVRTIDCAKLKEGDLLLSYRVLIPVMPIYSLVLQHILPRKQIMSTGRLPIYEITWLYSGEQAAATKLNKGKLCTTHHGHCPLVASSLILGYRMAPRVKGVETLTRPSHAAVQFANTLPYN